MQGLDRVGQLHGALNVERSMRMVYVLYDTLDDCAP